LKIAQLSAKKRAWAKGTPFFQSETKESAPLTLRTYSIGKKHGSE
jgi:hypothetical protein